MGSLKCGIQLSCFANCSDSSTGKNADASHGHHGRAELGSEGGRGDRQCVDEATGAGVVADFLVDAENASARLEILEVACVEAGLRILVQGDVGEVAGHVGTERLQRR